jgi:uncharacterized protein YbaA (DUF1428 family)
MRYVDGYLLPIPKKSVAAYTKLAKLASKVWKEHGALEYVEAVGDDLAVKMGISFKKRSGAKPADTVVFAFIVYKSRADRDRVNAAVMKDPRIAKMMNAPMPFDMKRMSYGGFKAIVDA